ncbi:MAG TPA: sigma-70 family RNA polymerase sigma factor [Gemmatimonadaceae bacterium]|nr:sigma-70 family RNA polymerase sigma factor [Gemmatimonadaceae bacterium]
MIDVARAGEDASDQALIERWRAGDERAATALVERHAAALARFAASLGAWNEVDELVQDTFVRAFGSLDSFRHDASLRTWLFTILRRLLLDRRRAARRDRGAVPLEAAALATEHGALDALLAGEAEARVRRAVQGLTRLQREVFTLRVSEGASYREIAEVLGTTEGAARVHYHNAVRAVKEALDD